MPRYYFDDLDGTLDEIDTEEELREEKARAEVEAENYEAWEEFIYYHEEYRRRE